MTRTVFDSREAFMKWLMQRNRPYEVYYTEDRIFAVPLVSTRPVIYGVLVKSDVKDVVEGIRNLTEIDEADIYPLKDFEFDESRGMQGGDNDS